MVVKFGTGRGPSHPPSKFHPHRCNVLPLRGEKPQNRPLSNLVKYGCVALREMLPVITDTAGSKRNYSEKRKAKRT